LFKKTNREGAKAQIKRNIFLRLGALAFNLCCSEQFHFYFVLTENQKK